MRASTMPPTYQRGQTEDTVDDLYGGLLWASPRLNLEDSFVQRKEKRHSI
jgi:hypothetical protein